MVAIRRINTAVVIRYRYYQLTAALSSIAIVVSIAAQLSAQQMPLPTERAEATSYFDMELSDTFGDTEYQPASDWTEPLRSCDRGISIEPVYYGEVFTNARGGLSTDDATQYQALFDLPLTLDFQKSRLPLPGRFFLLAQNTHGRGLPTEIRQCLRSNRLPGRRLR